jgi:alkanesulfonate monooxygenase SsuD/methylene tetrahydromethanopterin reductase-like flavin-dependent oxidoreductase (luciferase family)
MQQQFIRLRRGNSGKLPPPIDPEQADWSRDERLTIAHTLRYSIVGAPDTVARGLHAFVERTSADEVLITGHIADHAARLRSFELVGRMRATW